MKKTVAIIFNDVHLKTGNEEGVLDSAIHMIGYAVEYKIKNIIFAGDFFHSRSFQRESVLRTFDEILERMHKAGLTLYLFAGNHDKTVYKSYTSFLDSFRYHPCVKFNKDLKRINLEGITIDLLPFFHDDMLIPKLEEAEGADVLISHFEMYGSTHLGKVSTKSSINKTLLKKWKKVYLGHYHNHHEITKDIVHLPSFRQNDFGEDSNKGFTLLYDDLSYEIVKGKFKELEKISINIDDYSTKDLKELVEKNKDSESSIRFELVGSDSKLKALDKSIFKSSGIDVKVKYESKYNFDDLSAELPKVTEVYGKNEIKEVFKKFCEDKLLEYSEGIKFLEEFLKDK